MSQENVGLLHQVNDAFTRRDLDAFLALNHAEVEFTPLNAALEGGGPYRGQDEIRKWWGNLYAVFPDFGLMAREVRDLGAVTVALTQMSGRGIESAASTEQAVWQVAEWRAGKMTWWHIFDSESEALEAAGRRE